MSAVTLEELNKGDNINITANTDMKITYIPFINNNLTTTNEVSYSIPQNQQITGTVFSKTNKQINIDKDRHQFIIPITALENFTITINKKNTILELTDEEKAANIIKMDAQGEKAAIAYREYDNEAARRKETQEKAEKDAANKDAAERGPWQKTTSEGKVNLVKDDRIIIIILKKDIEIKIKTSDKKNNTMERDQGDKYTTLKPNFQIIGTVTEIGDGYTNMVIQPDDEKNRLLFFPLIEKPNLEILTTEAEGNELTEKLFLQLYKPDIYHPDFICELIINNPNLYKKLHDANALPKLTEELFRKLYKPDIHHPNVICELIKNNPILYKKLHDAKRLPEMIDKEGKKYKCNNGVAYKAGILSRFFGPPSSGGKKSRKINKKKIPTRRKTTRKTTRKTIRKTIRKTRRKTIKKIYKKK